MFKIYLCPAPLCVYRESRMAEPNRKKEVFEFYLGKGQRAWDSLKEQIDLAVLSLENNNPTQTQKDLMELARRLRVEADTIDRIAQGVRL